MFSMIMSIVFGLILPFRPQARGPGDDVMILKQNARDRGVQEHERYTKNEDVESQKELEDWGKYGRGNSPQPEKLDQVLA